MIDQLYNYTIYPSYIYNFMRKKKNMWRKRNTLKSRYQVIYKQNKKKSAQRYIEKWLLNIYLCLHIYTRQ